MSMWQSPNQVALVTGAARGIGAATVTRLVHAGFNVLAFDWCAGDDSPVAYPQATHSELEALVRSLPQDTAIPVVGDVRDEKALAEAVARAHQTWGRLDVAVAAAAVMAGGAPVWQDTSLPLLWEINVTGVWQTATATIPSMLEGPDPTGCRFVALASAAGERGLYHLAAYTTTKHAVVGMVRSLAADLIGTGVTACAIAPGSTDTAMLDATAKLYNVSRSELESHQLLGRALDGDEVAAAVSLACSPSGAALNGSIVNADGGFSG